VGIEPTIDGIFGHMPIITVTSGKQPDTGQLSGILRLAHTPAELYTNGKMLIARIRLSTIITFDESGFRDASAFVSRLKLGLQNNSSSIS
jgi:hypothetical protein